MSEDLLSKLKHPSSALVLIQKEAWINVEARTACWMSLDAHAKSTFAFDEAR